MTASNTRKTAKILAAGLAIAIGLGAAAQASADTVWQQHHPRREEVNNRLANQSHRISQERREGELTRSQARDLRAEDRGIRAQERFYASRDGSHISKAEQLRLNREENRVSHQIGH